MAKYIVHWKTGAPTEIEGPDVQTAFALAGIGGGAVPAIDYWEEVKEEKATVESNEVTA